MLTWNIIRAAGIGAYLMLWASVTWGLISTTSVFGKKASKATTVALHQAFSTSGLLLLATHIIALVFDSFMPFSWLDVIVPLRSSFRPVGVALGIGAMFVTLLGVLSTSWGRKVIGTKWWRRTHSLSVPGFALALMHGLMTGTDTSRPGMFWMYVASAGILLFLLLLRALTAGQRPQRIPVPHGVTPRIASNLPARAAEGPRPVPEKVGSSARAERPQVERETLGVEEEGRFAMRP